MKVIFLDVDGVLNSMAYFEELKKSGKILHSDEGYNDISEFHLQMLAKIVEKTGAKVVLCSTWRVLQEPDKPELYTMYKYLEEELGRYKIEIVDSTPIERMNRPKEIKTWLEKNPIESFVILDDDFSPKHYQEFGLEEHLVQTRYFCWKVSEGGLQQEHVDKAIKILGGNDNE